MKRILIVICLWMTACASSSTPMPASPTQTSPTLTQPPPPTSTSIPATKPSTETVIQVTATFAPQLEPSNWKAWPVIPDSIDPSLQNIYQRGLALGNDPHAFSIFGDCQTRPGEFFGVFESDADVYQSLSPQLRETVEYFYGSFNREASTTQDGTTPGALLWTQWHRGEFGCTFAETPVECELRTHRPSFVLIQVGTHFESRNTEYLRKIILQLLDAGVIPILATKADNREKDERVNRDMAMLAAEYDLPLWNFWAAVSDLPNRGLYTRSDRPQQGDIYLTEEASERHRLTGLEALNAVWQAVIRK